MYQKHTKCGYITGVLVIIFLILITGTGWSAYKYYTSPEYIAGCYVRQLLQKDYKSIYRLLEKASVNKHYQEKDIEKYYKKIYERQDQLTDARIISGRDQIYRVRFTYGQKQKEEAIQLVKEGRKWRVRFPFTQYQLEVFAPRGCQVYLDDQKLEEVGAGRYQGENLLPARYMLQVRLPVKKRKCYYHLVSVPQDQAFVLPLETGTVSVRTGGGLMVTVGRFRKISSNHQTVFDELLPGMYEISVKDQTGFLKPQTMKLKIEKGNSSCTMTSYSLSEKGEEKRRGFLKDFYEIYQQAVEKRRITDLRQFASGGKMTWLEEDFYDWYINRKNIKHCDFDIVYGKYYIDENRKLHQQVTENAILDNEGKTYKLKLTWDTVINITKPEWKIETRELIESMAAQKEEDGTWVQY